MKKISAFLAATTMALAFTACEDVPAPYGINNGENEGGGEVSETLINESFATSLGSFTAVNTEGNYPWTCSYSCAQVTSYADTDGDGTKDNNPAESWLVSAKMDLTEVDAAYVTFDYILRYANSNEVNTNYQVLASADYAGNPATATWTALAFKPTQGSDWDNWYNSGNLALPAELCHTAGVVVALRYKAASKAATWEVKNFVMKQGVAEQPSQPEEPGEVTGELPFEESFETSLGAFTNYTTSGAGAWINDYKTAKASGYDNSTKVTTPGTYYLVSPEINLEGKTAAHLAYEYILRYDKGQENQQVLITAAFDPANPAEGWTLLNGTHTEGTDWSTFAKADVAIPEAFLGKKVRIALRYNTTDDGSTWEVKNFRVAEGQPGEGGNTGDGEGGGDAGDPKASNGDFENWANGKPVNWTTASTAGNATLSQSTDAHSGSYSVKVGGTNSANKRIAYKELTLPAGTYTMKFYAKGTGADGSVRPGYVPITDGKVGSYVYGDYTNGLTNSEWTEVTHTFELAAETTVCVLIMNSKKPGLDVLIDDFTLTDGAGKAIIY